MQLTSYALASALEDLIAVSGIFDPADVWVGCYSTVVDQGLATTVADVTPCTGSLAPLQQVSEWSPVYTDKAGVEVCDAGVMRFTPSSTADAQTVQGIYLMSAASGGDLLGFVPFATSVPLAGPQNILSVVVRLTLDPSGQWDATVTWDD